MYDTSPRHTAPLPRRLPTRQKLSRLATMAALGAFLLTGVTGMPTHLLAQDDAGYVVIVHPDNPVTALSRREVSGLLLKKTTQWDDRTAVLPVDLTAGSEVRQAFTETVHRRKVPAVKNYWAQSIFSGRADPPPEMADEGSVVGFVASNRGAIGYVAPSADVSSVKVVEISN